MVTVDKKKKKKKPERKFLSVKTLFLAPFLSTDDYRHMIVTQNE
jgi:hypothetical protein